jgi:hypothetical protein
VAWSNITTADLLGQLTPVEQAVLNNIMGGIDALPVGVLRDINKIRGQIRAGGYLVDQINLVSLPDQLIPEALDYMVWDFLGTFPGLKAMKTKDRQDVYEEARKLFDQVAQGKINIESPLTAAAPPAAQGGSQHRIRGRMGHGHII